MVHMRRVVLLLIGALAVLGLQVPAAQAADAVVSQGKAATASSQESASYPAANAFDGNTATRWSSAFSDPQWLQVDLGASYVVSRVVLTWEAAYGKAYRVQTSPDGTTWTDVYATTTGDGATDDLTVTGSGRYVRVYGTARATPYGYSLWEMAVYGHTATPPPPPTGYVSASGTTFTLNGAPFRFIGFNAYGMAGCYNGTPWTTAQLDTYFSHLPAYGVTRLWAFHTYGTAALQTIVTEAAKYSQHLVLTLGDDDSNCGDTDGAVGGAGSGKTQAFYTSGWKTTWLTWVNTVVPLFKDNPTVMMWENANEPGQAGYRPTPAEMQAYVRGTTDAIRADDPNHLISVGANDAANFGSQAAEQAALAAPNVNAVSFHDYSYEYENKAVVSGNFTAAKQMSAALGKPFYGGEAGAVAGASGCALSLTGRRDFLKSKTDTYFGNGLGGILYWEQEPSRASWVGACAYEAYPTDPLVPFVQGYIL